MRRYRLLALTPSIIAALAASADAGPQRRVGVVVTVSVGISGPESDKLGDALGAALAAQLPIDVISGAEVSRRMPPEGVHDECVGDAACRNDLGRRLDADELLLVALVKVGERINVDATWADVASGRTASRPRISLEPTDDARQRFAERATRYLPHIRPEADSETEPKIVLVPSSTSGSDDRDSGRRLTLPVLIAGGTAVAAGITGGVFGLAARARFNELERSGCRETDTCDPDAVDGGKRRALAADLLFGGALAAGVTAGVLYFLSGPDEPADDRPQVSVTGGADRVGVAIGGRF